MSEHPFDDSDLLNGLRCRPSDRLAQRREWLVREQRRLHVEELAVLRVLDERGQVDDSLASVDGVSVREVRDTVATARALEDLPFWWRHDRGMLDGRFSLPDVDGALFERVIDGLAETMRPAKGQAWETRERRGADALVELCRSHAGRRADDTCTAPEVHMIVEVPLEGPAQMAGIPLPDATVERLRASARVEPVLVDHDGAAITVGRTEAVLSAKTKRVVRQRDGHCRWPGCGNRTGLEIHHLWPRSWGGSDEIANLATVCGRHHARLAPQGTLLLLGNPNHRAGLTLVDREQLATLAADRARAGPGAAA